MKLTNVHNLPETFVRAVRNDDYDAGDSDITVTQLINPPQLVELQRQHEDEIVRDAAEMGFILMGKAIHYVLERAAVENALVEERLFATVRGWKVSGQFDLFEGGGATLAEDTLTDWKITSVWAFMFGDKPEWTAQLNLCAALLRLHGFEPKRLQIGAILRDWQKSKRGETNYPNNPVILRPVKMWHEDEAYNFLVRRVELHQHARSYGVWQPCNAAERWAKPDTWAVKRKNVKKAMRVLDSEAAAQRYIEAQMQDKQRPMSIEFREGSSTRCSDYCDALKWCAQGQGLVKKAPKEEEQTAAEEFADMAKYGIEEATVA